MIRVGSRAPLPPPRPTPQPHYPSWGRLWIGALGPGVTPLPESSPPPTPPVESETPLTGGRFWDSPDYGVRPQLGPTPTAPSRFPSINGGDIAEACFFTVLLTLLLMGLHWLQWTPVTAEECGWGAGLEAGAWLSRRAPSPPPPPSPQPDWTPPEPDKTFLEGARRWMEEWDSSLALNKKELELGVIQRYSWPKGPEAYSAIRESYPSSGIPCSPEQQAWAEEAAWNLVRLRAFQRGEEKKEGLVSTSGGPSPEVETPVLPTQPLHPLPPLETFGEYVDWVDWLGAHPQLPSALMVATTLALLSRWSGGHPTPAHPARLVGERGRATYRTAFSHYSRHRSALVGVVVEGVLDQAVLRKVGFEAKAALPSDLSPTPANCASHPQLRRLWALTLVQEVELGALVAAFNRWGVAAEGTRAWAQWVHTRWQGELNPLLDPKSPTFQPLPEASSGGVANLLEQQEADLAQDEDRSRQLAERNGLTPVQVEAEVAEVVAKRASVARQSSLLAWATTPAVRHPAAAAAAPPRSGLSCTRHPTPKPPPRRSSSTTSAALLGELEEALSRLPQPRRTPTLGGLLREWRESILRSEGDGDHRPQRRPSGGHRLGEPLRVTLWRDGREYRLASADGGENYRWVGVDTAPAAPSGVGFRWRKLPPPPEVPQRPPLTRRLGGGHRLGGHPSSPHSREDSWDGSLTEDFWSEEEGRFSSGLSAEETAARRTGVSPPSTPDSPPSSNPPLEEARGVLPENTLLRTPSPDFATHCSRTPAAEALPPLKGVRGVLSGGKGGLECWNPALEEPFWRVGKSAFFPSPTPTLSSGHLRQSLQRLTPSPMTDWAHSRFCGLKSGLGSLKLVEGLPLLPPLDVLVAGGVRGRRCLRCGCCGGPFVDHRRWPPPKPPEGGGRRPQRPGRVGPPHPPSSSASTSVRCCWRGPMAPLGGKPNVWSCWNGC